MDPLFRFDVLHGHPDCAECADSLMILKLFSLPTDPASFSCIAEPLLSVKGCSVPQATQKNQRIQGLFKTFVLGARHHRLPKPINPKR